MTAQPRLTHRTPEPLRPFAGKPGAASRRRQMQRRRDEHVARIDRRALTAQRVGEMIAGLPENNTVRQQAELVREALTAELGGLGHRRAAELEVADYIASHVSPHDVRLIEQAERMRVCHTEGAWGVHADDQSAITAWDHHCGDGHLCPHEVRAEQQRLIRRYLAPMLVWQAQKPRLRRFFYAVFTVPNVPPGELAAGKRRAWALFSEWIRARRPVTDEDRWRYRWSARKRVTTRWLADPEARRDDGIHGWFARQEDPLSAHHDWNVHINVLLPVEGPFSFAEVQRTWADVVGRPDAQVHCQEITRRHVPGAKTNLDALRIQLMEVVKYSAKLVGCPRESAKDDPNVPPLVAWPWERFREWYAANKGSRRTRTGGCLYRVPQPDPMDMARVLWMGRINWQGGRYWASLTPADNFSSSQPRKGDEWAHQRDPQPPPGSGELARSAGGYPG